MSEMQPLTSTSWAAGWYAAVVEQFTYFGTLQLDGREGANPTGQYEGSSITQLVAGRSINDRFALQLNVPLIYREFLSPPRRSLVSFLIGPVWRVLQGNIERADTDLSREFGNALLGNGATEHRRNGLV